MRLNSDKVNDVRKCAEVHRQVRPSLISTAALHHVCWPDLRVMLCQHPRCHGHTSTG